jgi:hypothetical protein
MGITNNIPPSRLIQPGVIDNAAARPAAPYEGQCIFQKDTDQLLVWNGTAWVIPNQTTTNPEGFELIKTQTVGTGVTTVTVTDAFSSVYENYRIIYSGGTQSASNDVYLQIGGSTTGYYGVLIFTSSTSNTPQAAANNNNNRADWIGGAVANQSSHISVDVLGPFNSAYTKIRNGSYQNDNFYGTYQGEHRVATSYTSFLIGVAAGTLTGGTIRVYGYRNS